MINTNHSPSHRNVSRLRQGICCALAILVILFGAVLNPLGLLVSHGSAELAALQHEAAHLDHDHHGHHHNEPSLGHGHPHHAGDHSHETAHAVPVPLLQLGLHTPVLSPAPIKPSPWPSLAGLERPPRV